MPAADETRDLPRFTGMALDRAHGRRKDAAWIERQLRDPAARVVLAGPDGVVVGDEEVLRAPSRLMENREPILLGLEDGAPRFAVDLDGLDADDPAAAIDGGEVVALRDAGAVLPGAEAGLAAYVMAMLNWHRRHRFCANCGHATNVAEAGDSRHCPSCGANHFPRTDPVVIMTVEHDGRLLLGRRAGWPPGRLSVLAGFVAPGESAEEAVVREVREESGIIVRDPVFVASQPWPFPASLMLGFHAESDGGEPRPSDGELEEVHWLDLDAVRAAMGDGESSFRLPPSISIARFLIDRWVAGRGAEPVVDSGTW
ncbi:MAG TPA: NAD(+) diphosphatase [Solirubrobacteraceae bacterium]|jgi:NAD+ diphosphatase|nr:NAD(+) diphosphatase [Solirubrobacteraceae bacterium]